MGQRAKGARGGLILFLGHKGRRVKGALLRAQKGKASKGKL